MTRRYGQRQVDKERWRPWRYVCDARDGVTLCFDVKHKGLAPVEINAASNTCIILFRIMRKVKMRRDGP